MARSNEHLEREVIPAWKAFLHGLFQTEDAERLATAMTASRGKKSHDPKGNLATWLRVHLAKPDPYAYRTVGRPISRIVWDIGEAAPALGHDWVNGTIALFAAGYFDEYVRVMSIARYHDAPKKKMLELAASAEAAVKSDGAARLTWAVSSPMRRRLAQAWAKRHMANIEREPELFIAAEVERHPIWRLDVQRSLVTEFLKRRFERT